MSDEAPRRWIVFAIGVTTVTTGLFAWQAGQIGSEANYDDRQSISQQIDRETVSIDVAVEATRQARQYDRYLLDYARADQEDDPAAADAIRTEATNRAFAGGVFDQATFADATVTAEPRPFDLEDRIVELRTAATTGINALGGADPQVLADASDEIRSRMRSLTQWIALLLVAVVCFTAAEVTVTDRVRRIAAPLGCAVYAVALVGGLTNGYLG